MKTARLSSQPRGSRKHQQSALQHSVIVIKDSKSVRIVLEIYSDPEPADPANPSPSLSLSTIPALPVATPQPDPVRSPYCIYSLPDAFKSRDEIEDQLTKASHQSATSFARHLRSLEKKKCLDFCGDSATDIYAYFLERYPYLSFGLKTFLDAFKSRN